MRSLTLRVLEKRQTRASMQQEFSPPLTRLDAVLWFLRVQLWVSVVYFVSSLVTPFVGFGALISWQTLCGTGLPLLVYLLFSRVLAVGVLGQSARDSISTLPDFRPLMGRCVGLSLFVSSLGRVISLTFLFAYSLLTGKPLYGSILGSSILFGQVVVAALSFFLGFFLAFGPVIRDNFRAR